MAARFPVAFVVGVGHAGSNLLSRLLDRHPAVRAVGEMAWIDRGLAEGRSCTCGEAYAACPFWGPLLPALEGGHGYDHRRFTPALYERVREAAGAEVVLDMSKTRVWRFARRWRRAGYVLLVRDSRGVLAAALRKGDALDRVLPRHVKWMSRWSRFARRRADRTLVLRYEDLARDPAAALERTCKFLGLSYDAALLAPGGGASHLLYSEKTGALDRGSEVRLDERWREELAPADRERIARAMRRVPLLRELYADALV